MGGEERVWEEKNRNTNVLICQGWEVGIFEKFLISLLILSLHLTDSRCSRIRII